MTFNTVFIYQWKLVSSLHETNTIQNTIQHLKKLR